MAAPSPSRWWQRPPPPAGGGDTLEVAAQKDLRRGRGKDADGGVEAGVVARGCRKMCPSDLTRREGGGQ